MQVADVMTRGVISVSPGRFDAEGGAANRLLKNR